MAKPKEVLHFFPGTFTMVWAVNGAAVLKAEAWGGESPEPGVHYDVMKPRRTTPGSYVIFSYEPYRTNTWEPSRINWGTRLKLDSTGANVLFENRSGHKGWSRVLERVPKGTKANIQAAYYSLYGLSGKYDSDGDLIPDVWVFNDFGAYAVRYYKDKNHNKKFDRDSEKLSGEMIHTTPDNEAQVAQGQEVIFKSSHGCIHMNPLDRDKFHTAGAFDRGVDLIIHKYSAPVPTAF